MCCSLYRLEQKRKKWFFDFSLCPTAPSAAFDSEQVRFDTFCSDCRGGQNANKVETSVCAVYLPTGQDIVCTGERSQYANKQKAVARLHELFRRDGLRRKASEKNDNWKCHTAIERGNAGVRFEGMGFQRLQ